MSLLALHPALHQAAPAPAAEADAARLRDARAAATAAGTATADTAAAAAQERNVIHPYLLTTSVHEPRHAVTWPAHTHPEHELLWTDRGVVTMLVDGRQWTVTPGIGLWIPAGVEHEGATRDTTEARATYFAPAGWDRPWDEPVAVRVVPAVRELLIHIKRAPMSMEQRLRAQQVCVDMLERTESVQLDVPIPTDRRLALLVEMLLHDPADDRSLEQWASLLNVTARTLTRIFTAEVAVSFAQWRRLVRMRAAVGELADGASVKSVAHRVGYSTTSAFVTAFRKTVGCTPGELAGKL